jgi:hypothetical protein
LNPHDHPDHNRPPVNLIASWSRRLHPRHLPAAPSNLAITSDRPLSYSSHRPLSTNLHVWMHPCWLQLIGRSEPPTRSVQHHRLSRRVTWWRGSPWTLGKHLRVTWWRGSPWTSPEGHADGCDWRVGLGAWITSSGDHMDGCDGRVGPNVWQGKLLGLVPHRKLMVGEHNIKVEVVLTHQASLLGWVRPRAWLLWAPVDLGLVRRWLVGIAGRAGFRCATLTTHIWFMPISEPKYIICTIHLLHFVIVDAISMLGLNTCTSPMKDIGKANELLYWSNNHLYSWKSHIHSIHNNVVVRYSSFTQFSNSSSMT